MLDSKGKHSFDPARAGGNIASAMMRIEKRALSLMTDNWRL